MTKVLRRRVNRRRIRVESLEARSLMAVAGSLDPRFGSGYGSTTAPLDVPVLVAPYPYYSAQTDSLVALPNGNVLVSGTVDLSQLDYGVGNSELVIEELNADGSPDKSFGTAGRVQLPIGFDDSFTMAVQANGQILVASATVGGSGVVNSYLVARLNVNGSLDTTFGSQGIAEYPANSTTPIADRLDQVVSVLLQSNNQIILAGNSPAGYSTVRLAANGSIDTTYGQEGTSTVPIMIGQGYSDDVTAATIQANGQVVLTGNVSKPINSESGLLVAVNINSEVGVIRLDTDGSLDPTFGGSTAAGIVLIPYELANPSVVGDNMSTAVAVQPTTGDILVEGSGLAPVTLYRLSAGGTLDTSFGVGGLLEPVVPLTTDIIHLTMAVQANGDILLAESLSYSTLSVFGYKLELLRLDPDGSPDATFGNSSTPGTLLTNLTTTGSPIPASPASPAIQPTTGDILLAGVGTLASPTGLTYGLSVDSILPQATTGLAAPTPRPIPPANFSGLGYTNAGVYDPSIGSFVYQYAPGTVYTSTTVPFGIAGVGQTIPVAADYQGLGFTQIGVYLTASGVYAIQPNPTSPGLFLQFGMPGAGNSIPVPADYEGTGKADVAVYMPSSATFAILPSNGAAGRIVQFGIAGAGQSIPASADYYHTGQADIAVYLAASGTFAIQNPTGQTAGKLIAFGKPGLGNSIPVPGDYDGSGQAELAVYVPSAGAYFYRPAGGGNDVIVPIGVANSGDIPVPGDYDGSGRTEAAIYSPSGDFIEYAPADGGPDVTMNLGPVSTSSIPLTATLGALPEFSGLHPGSSNAANQPVLASSATPGAASPSPAAITLSGAAAVPTGPTLASIRVARTLVNQGVADPFKLT